MIKTGYNLFPVLLLLLILSGPTDLSAQTAGKLAGRVTDESGQALIGATIIVEGTNKGAVTDYDGYYTVLNLRAGTYSVEYRYTGFQTKKISAIQI